LRWLDVKPDPAQDDSELPLAVTVATDATTPFQCDLWRVFRTVQVSEPTQGLWGQFLPDARVLSGNATPALVKDMKITPLGVTPDGKADAQTVKLSAAGQVPHWLAEPVQSTKDDQGLFNLLLLTREVAGTAGGPQEAYVGLYRHDAPLSDGIRLIRLQESAKDTSTSVPVNADKLVGRILTLRLNRRSDDPSPEPGISPFWRRFKAGSTDDIWSNLFPSERSGPTDSVDPSRVYAKEGPVGDARWQIIEIYAPIAKS
jgi:hypothetical protein